MFEIISKIKKLDWFYFSLIFFLSFVGFIMIYSATSGMENNVLFSHSIKILLGWLLCYWLQLLTWSFGKKMHFIYILFVSFF